ncbi:DNA cytosine methyltransferase [Veillonella caviae]|uniref:DNA cytosine methyltransferase n=1 Tax=Veillonella caviae TaxID=248316 RepID=UPI0023F926A0|nr:DNA cytosine methyltransferase [Veillonella caviae]
MLKVGTVFSGIGAVEHALERLNIPFEIEFACDNGDVDILSKPINKDILSLEYAFQELSSKVLHDETVIRNFSKNIDKLKKDILDSNIEEKLILKLYKEYARSPYINDSQRKAYDMLLKYIKSKDSYDKKLAFIKLSVKLEADVKRSHWNKEISSTIESYNSQYRKIIKELNLLSEALSMAYEKINTEAIRQSVFNLTTLKEQKVYVDNLYKGSIKKNKVRESYLANYPIHEDKFHWNVSFLDGNHYKNNIDLFVGGSPCQSFSLVGKQRGLDDTRGTLFYEFARLISEIKPKVFIYENVKALLSNDNGETWKTVQKIFDDLGYDWFYQILNAKDYGIPQNRERLFVVGFRKDLEITSFSFPSSIPLERVMQDFLLDNVSGKYYLPSKGVDFVTSEKNLSKRYTQIDGDVQLCQKKNQQFNWHGDFIFEADDKNKESLTQDLQKYFLSEKVKKYVLSSGTKGFYSKPETDLAIARPLLQSMHKMHRAGVDNYVTTEGRLRKLTPRECLRLMGFCDSFKIVVSDTAAYQQSGNSIVVDVLMHIINKIIDVYPELGD